jgi:heptosyltransferase-2
VRQFVGALQVHCDVCSEFVHVGYSVAPAGDRKMSEFTPKTRMCDWGSGSQRAAAAAAIFKKYWGRRRLAVRMLEVFLKPLTWFSKSARQLGLDQVERILVFEPGSLGDMVMLMPFLKSLRARFPQSSISLLCRTSGNKGQNYARLDHASTKTLLLDQGCIDELIPVAVPWLVDVSPWKKYNPISLNWPRFVWKLLRLRRLSFDLAFPSGRSDIRYNLVLWLTGAKRRVGYGYAGADFLLTDIAVPDITRPHQTEVCLQLLEHLGIPVIRDGQFLKLSSEDERFSANFLNGHDIETDDLVVGIHAGARTANRTWGEERFRQVAQRLTEEFGAKVIWFADPIDSNGGALGRNIVSVSFPLRDFLAVLARCSFIVCNDSGPMHMAGALGVPVVAIFGSTFPEWFCPPGENHRVVVRRDMPCRPCGDRCLLDEPYCLRLIPVEQVMHAVEETVKTVAGNYISAEGRE